MSLRLFDTYLFNCGNAEDADSGDAKQKRQIESKYINKNFESYAITLSEQNRRETPVPDKQKVSSLSKVLRCYDYTPTALIYESNFICK